MKKSLLFILVLVLFVTTNSVAFAQKRNPNDYKGMNLILETGGFAPDDYNKISGWSPVAVVGGFTFNRHLFIGGGLGVNYSWYYRSVSIPIFARIKVTFLKTKFSPFVSLNLGCNAASRSSNYYDSAPNEKRYLVSNAFISPEVGIQMRTKERQAVHFSFGYMKMRGGNDRLNSAMSRFSAGTVTFRVGYTF